MGGGYCREGMEEGYCECEKNRKSHHNPEIYSGARQL